MELTNLLSTLDRAIEAEHEAQQFYSAAAEKTDDPGGAAMFRQLAEFEAHHQQHLEALKASLTTSGSWIPYPARELSKIPSGKSKGRAPAGAHADAIEALRIAIGAEEKAEQEYRALAEQADDSKGKHMFVRLAQEEALHRKLLDDQYYALTNKGLWVWGD